MSDLRYRAAAAVRSLDDFAARQADEADAVAARVFREVLLGELSGDVPRTLSVLAPDYTVEKVHGAAGATSLGREECVTSVTAFAASGGALWIEWSDLLVQRLTIAGRGVQVTLTPADSGVSVSTTDLAIFSSVAGGLAQSEVIFLGATSSEVIPDGAVDLPLIRSLGRGAVAGVGSR